MRQLRDRFANCLFHLINIFLLLYTQLLACVISVIRHGDLRNEAKKWKKMHFFIENRKCYSVAISACLRVTFSLFLSITR